MLRTFSENVTLTGSLMVKCLFTNIFTLFYIGKALNVKKYGSSYLVIVCFRWRRLGLSCFNFVLLPCCCLSLRNWKSLSFCTPDLHSQNPTLLLRTQTHTLTDTHTKVISDDDVIWQCLDWLPFMNTHVPLPLSLLCLTMLTKAWRSIWKVT